MCIGEPHLQNADKDSIDQTNLAYRKALTVLCSLNNQPCELLSSYFLAISNSHSRNVFQQCQT